MRRGWSPSSFHLRGHPSPSTEEILPLLRSLCVLSFLVPPFLPFFSLILSLSLSLSLSVSRCSRLSFHPRAIDVARLSNECARSDNGDGACYVLVGRRKTGGGRTNERSNEREESCNDDEDEVTVTATSANTGAPDTNRSSPRHCFPTSSVNTHTHTHTDIYIYIHTHSHTASPNNALCQQ